ncbi:hypothetical protein NFI95_15400 [Acetobacteraceae bacterium KSS8]|uniref:DUF3892 domain-containing protein n=1 Tax=Endosaccharibacter trunci TaxID=2812733 RepID=A0ABT1WAB7_9PROT|nr:hypothetical protein [Acetobacteraceae bacterium KSS8]
MEKTIYHFDGQHEDGSRIEEYVQGGILIQDKFARDGRWVSTNLRWEDGRRGNDAVLLAAYRATCISRKIPADEPRVTRFLDQSNGRSVLWVEDPEWTARLKAISAAATHEEQQALIHAPL